MLSIYFILIAIVRFIYIYLYYIYYANNVFALITSISVRIV